MYNEDNIYIKGFIMDVSTTTAAAAQSTTEVDALKKSLDVQEQQVLKVLESASEESQQVTAQKTGLGVNLNISS